MAERTTRWCGASFEEHCGHLDCATVQEWDAANRTLPTDLRAEDWIQTDENGTFVQRWRDRYTVLWVHGDWDERNLPRENDLTAFDTLEEAERERKMLIKEFNTPDSHYIILRSRVTPWEVLDVES